MPNPIAGLKWFSVNFPSTVSYAFWARFSFFFSFFFPLFSYHLNNWDCWKVHLILEALPPNGGAHESSLLFFRTSFAASHIHSRHPIFGIQCGIDNPSFALINLATPGVWNYRQFLMGCKLQAVTLLKSVQVGLRERVRTSLMEREGDKQILRWNSVSTWLDRWNKSTKNTHSEDFLFDLVFTRGILQTLVMMMQSLTQVDLLVFAELKLLCFTLQVGLIYHVTPH